MIVFSSSAVFAEFLQLHSNPNPDLSSCSILILFSNGPFLVCPFYFPVSDLMFW